MKSSTLMKPLSQILCNLFKASSLSSSREMLYLGIMIGSDMKALNLKMVMLISVQNILSLNPDYGALPMRRQNWGLLSCN